jgi:hypothetical protein
MEKISIGPDCHKIVLTDFILSRACIHIRFGALKNTDLKLICLRIDLKTNLFPFLQMLFTKS